MLRRLSLVVVPVLLALSCGTLTPASLEFLGAFPPQPGIGESTTLQFLARDSRGEPMAGVEVRFSVAGGDAAGVSVSPRVGLTNRGTGIAEVQVTSTRVQSVIIVAQAGEDPGDGGSADVDVRVAQSPPITFAGAGSPSGRQFTFQCGAVAGSASGGAHAIQAYDDTRYLIAGVKMECTAHVADRNGDGVPGVVVSFLTEAGTIGPSATSSADVVGNATTLYKTSYPLPKEVAPATFEMSPLVDDLHTGTLVAPLWMHPFDWKQNPVLNVNDPPDRQEPRRNDPVRGNNFNNNPRDNLVTMIAVTRGEEGYDDENNNGQWDEGEPNDDLTEPFVDSNDNGTWDEDERWVDTNGDGQWQGKNNLHDTDTLIWVAERILWTGVPHIRDFEDAVTPIFSRLTPVPQITHLSYARVQLLVADPWFNALAQNGGSDGCSGAANQLVEAAPDPFAGSAWEGVALSYPSPAFIEFLIYDAHTTTQPAFGSPVGFSLPIGCTYTGAPIDGYELVVRKYVDGTVL